MQADKRNQNTNAQKLTATMLIAMAAKQGIALRMDDGSATMVPADASLLKMREARADAAERAAAAFLRGLNGMTKERDDMVMGRTIMVERIATLTAECERLARQGCEALAERDALMRTVDRLRTGAGSRAAGVAPIAAPTVVDEAGAMLTEPYPGAVAVVDQVAAPVSHAEPTRTLRVTFITFPGWSTVQRLRAFGSWDKRAQAWMLRDTAETRAFLDTLTQTPPIVCTDQGRVTKRQGVRDPGEDAADRFHDRIDRQ